MKQSKKENGQIVVLLLLAIVGIFGFAALAVDMGRVYAERRRAQNAADAAAFATAFNYTQMANFYVAGLNSARENGFDDSDRFANPDKTVDVQIYNPPVSGRYSVASETIDPYQYFQVIIRSRVPPVFAQFVYGGPLEVTVEAIARGTGQSSFTKGASIVATCTNCCDALTFSGNGYIDVNDGDIISNSKMDGTSGCSSGVKNGTACIDVDNGSIIFAGDFDEGNKPTCKDPDGNVVPSIIGTVTEDPASFWGSAEPPTPTCPATTYSSKKIDGDAKVDCGSGELFSLCPGTYTGGITVTGKNTVATMAPGMYCLQGDLNVTSGSIMGDSVMIYLYRNGSDADPSVNITTGEPVVLTAPGIKTDKNGNVIDTSIPDNGVYDGFKWSGFLILMPYSENGSITLAGGNSTNYTGTIYAPGPTKTSGITKCKIVGNSESYALNASLICHTVDVGGGGTVTVNYLDDSNAQNPPMVELSK